MKRFALFLTLSLAAVGHAQQPLSRGQSPGYAGAYFYDPAAFNLYPRPAVRVFSFRSSRQQQRFAARREMYRQRNAAKGGTP